MHFECFECFFLIGLKPPSSCNSHRIFGLEETLTGLLDPMNSYCRVHIPVAYPMYPSEKKKGMQVMEAARRGCEVHLFGKHVYELFFKKKHGSLRDY